MDIYGDGEVLMGVFQYQKPTKLEEFANDNLGMQEMLRQIEWDIMHGRQLWQHIFNIVENKTGHLYEHDLRSNGHLYCVNVATLDLWQAARVARYDDWRLPRITYTDSVWRLRNTVSGPPSEEVRTSFVDQQLLKKQIVEELLQDCIIEEFQRRRMELYGGFNYNMQIYRVSQRTKDAMNKFNDLVFHQDHCQYTWTDDYY